MKPAQEIEKIFDDQTVAVCFPAVLGYERIAMECSVSFARLSGLMPERVEDLKTAVCEACTNAIEHGSKERAAAKVIVKMRCTEDAIFVWVIDEGEGIKAMPDQPDIDKKIRRLQTPRGLGIFLIKKLVDDVDFNVATDLGHAVRMMIRLPLGEKACALG
jgi:serine/threonine-protein kinase RsbW